MKKPYATIRKVGKLWRLYINAPKPAWRGAFLYKKDAQKLCDKLNREKS